MTQWAFKVTLVMVLAAAAVAAPSQCAENPGDSGHRSGHKEGDRIRIMSDAGVESPAEIESVIVRIANDGTYKVTYREGPEFVRRIYDALQEAYFVQMLVPAAIEFLTLNLRNGASIRLEFSTEPEKGLETVFLMQTFVAPKLLAPIQEVKKDAQAAVLDSRIGDFEVREIEVRTPRSRYWGRVPASSEEGKALIAKSKQIVDWVDLRSTAAEVPLPGEITGAQAKFGVVILYLAKPIEVEVMVWDKATAPAFPNPVAHNVSFKKLSFDRIKVLDYGNYVPPLVALVEKFPASNDYLCTYLTRREQEKYGVEHYGFPGHPASDTEYYKSPKILYKELQELTKAAYDKYAPKPKE